MNAGRFTVYGGATTLKKDFPGAAALFAECFTRPTFPQDEYAKVQQLALGAIARRAADPYQEISEFFCDQLPAGSPYRIVHGGKTETVQKLAPEDLKKYHDKFFVPNNMIVTVFGDIDEEKALELVTKEFGGLKASPDFRPASFDRSNVIPETVVRHLTIGKPTAIALFGYPTASILDKKDYAAMTLLNTVMAGYRYPGGWLHTELRGEGLVYSVHAFQATGPAPGFFQIMAQTQPEKLHEVVQRIQNNVQRAKEGKVTEDEFRTAVQLVLALHAQENTTIGEQAMQAALDELYGLGYEYHRTFDARIEAVQLQDLTNVAQKYFGNHVLVTSSPEKKDR
jgi:zinc protease